MTIRQAKALVSSWRHSDFEYPVRIKTVENAEYGDVFVSKQDGLYAISYPDARRREGYLKRYRLTEKEVLKIIEKKL